MFLGTPWTKRGAATVLNAQHKSSFLARPSQGKLLTYNRNAKVIEKSHYLLSKKEGKKNKKKKKKTPRNIK